MKKNKWSNFFGTALAGATVLTAVATGNHFAKKYGQKTNPNKFFDIKLANLLDYGFNKYIESDNENIVSEQ